MSSIERPDETSASRLTSATAIALYVAAARLVLYLIAAPNYGYFRDELYYLACGMRPAWGYVDQPPLIAWIAWLLEHLHATSLWGLRLLPTLADCAAIFISARIARELGGRRWAVFLAALATLMAPVALGISHLFTMNAFDPPLWTAMAYLLVRIATTGNQRLWIPFGLLAGVSILNKYAVLFWLAGVLIGLCPTPLRSSLRQRWFWIACLITTVIALPNFTWEVRNHFPFLELMHNVRTSDKDVSLAPLPYLASQAQMLGFVSAVLVICALIFCFSRRGRPARIIGWSFLIFLGTMLMLHGKMYYVAPVYPMVFAAGAVWFEHATSRRSVYWLRPLLALGIILVSGVYLPTILPILSVPHFLAYEQRLGIQQQKFENTDTGVLPQIYADMFGWEAIAQRVAAYYHSLPPEEQRNTAIFANNYGDAGAIDFFGPKYGLPRAIGGHQSYWLWGPGEYTGESMIVLGEHHERNMQTKCASYSAIGTTADPLSRRDEWAPIYHCRGLKWPLPTIWPNLKHWY